MRINEEKRVSRRVRSVRLRPKNGTKRRVALYQYIIQRGAPQSKSYTKCSARIWSNAAPKRNKTRRRSWVRDEILFSLFMLDRDNILDRASTRSCRYLSIPYNRRVRWLDDPEIGRMLESKRSIERGRKERKARLYLGVREKRVRGRRRQPTTAWHKEPQSHKRCGYVAMARVYVHSGNWVKVNLRSPHSRVQSVAWRGVCVG